MRTEHRTLDHFVVLLGSTLVLAGIILVLAQLVGVRVLALGWPLMIVLPGLVILAAAFYVPSGRGASFIAVPGAMVLVTGLILELQAVTGDWQSWSYVWALVAPGSLGLGLTIAGARENLKGVRIAGAVLLVAGAVLFVIAELFFVGLAGIGGPGLGWEFGLLLPVLLIGFGVWAIVWGLARNR
ncbi:MAG: hypothetical protein JXA36_04190 [Coriobacteriia bacterium]|nr:hypothetical protein [Coriobacteriia bacterium]